MEGLGGTELTFAGPYANKTVEVVEFTGQVIDSETTLYTLNVCPSEQYEALFVANYFITNITAFNPGTLNYYVDYVLPRVLPWAVSFFAIGLVFFLSFCIWRSIRCCCQSCCPNTGCGGCCKPSTSSGEALSGCWYRFLQVIITILLLGVIAISAWGCAVAGPQVLDTFWISVAEITEFAYWLTNVGAKAVTRTGEILSAGKDLVNYLERKINPADIERLLDCVTDFLNQLPDTAGELISLFEQLLSSLQGIPAALSTTAVSLQALKTSFLPSFAAVSAEVGAGTSFSQQILSGTNASLNAYGALPSSFTDAPGPVQDVVDANTALDIPGKIQQAAAISTALEGYGDVIASPAIGYASGNLTALLALLGTLKNTTVPAAKQTAQQVSSLVQDAIGCAQEAIGKAEAINETVVELPTESSSALNAASGQLQLLNGTAILDTVQPLLAKLDVPPVAQRLVADLQAAREAIGVVSQEDLDTASNYIASVSAALNSASDPVVTNTDDGSAFLAAGDELSYTRFDLSKLDAMQALSALETAAAPAPPNVLATFTKAAATARVLMAMDSSELDSVLQALQENLSDTNIAELQSLVDKMSSAIQDAKEVADTSLLDGIEKITDFIEQVQEGIGSVNDTLKVLDKELSSALREAERAVADVTRNVQTAEEIVTTAKYYAETVNYARVYFTYFIFIVCMVSSICIIFGVWFAVPFLYTFFTFVLLFMLVILFIVFIPYGTVVTVGSDACNLVESKADAIIDSLPQLDTKTKVALRGALDYYIYGAVYNSVWELLTDLTDIDIQQLLGEVQAYKAQIARELAKLKLRGEASGKVDIVFGAVDDAVQLVSEGIDSLTQPYINAAYVGLKSLMCCSVVGTSGLQWLAMFLAGCLICIAACFIYLFIIRLDGLPPKQGVCCPTCGCYRHRASDKNVLGNQFIVDHVDELHMMRSQNMGRI